MALAAARRKATSSLECAPSGLPPCTFEASLWLRTSTPSCTMFETLGFRAHTLQPKPALVHTLGLRL